MSSELNIYEKIQKIKEGILAAKIKKTGINKRETKTGKVITFKYYELSDFVPYIIGFCGQYKLLTTFNFSNVEGVLTITNAENLNEFIEYKVPMRKTTIQGGNEIQELGGSITYLKRYLYTNAFDITENDQFDCMPLVAEEYNCDQCGTKFENITHLGKSITAKVQYEQTKKKYGKSLCKKCREERE